MNNLNNDQTKESPPPILEIKNLVKHYGKITAVNDISFSINTGTCLGLLGPNGAGKTTTIEVIEGIIEPSSGKIFYKGLPRGKRFYEEVGIQFQNTELPLFLTVRETLATFRSLYGRATNFQKLIELCQLEEILDRDNQKISGGQKQRLLLAMALANNPDLVFLDEPTTGLDPQARHHLWDIVSQLKKQGTTIVLTTHYMEEAQLLCDNILIMDHGELIAEGTPKELLKNHGMSTYIRFEKKAPFPDKDSFKSGIVMERNNEIEIKTQDPKSCLYELLEAKIDFSGITIRSENLEDLFLSLTGHGLR